MKKSLYVNIIINLILSNINREKNLLKILHKRIATKRRTRKMIVLNVTKVKRRIPKIRNYFDVINKYPEDIFYNHFRMCRDTFKKLVEIIQTAIGTNYLPSTQMSIENSLYITIWKLANQESFRTVADRFNLSKGYAYKIIMVMCKVVCENMKLFIKWPSSDELCEINKKFEVLRGENSFPSVIGCVDCMHVPILALQKDSVSYYNRKGFHSMILQGICDSKCVLIDVFFGWPGRSHDASVWSNSPIGRALEEKRLNLPYRYHLLGDSAYKLFPYLMVNYRDNGFLTREQKVFNKTLNSSRVCIENTFGMLKSKFRILKFVDVKKLTEVKYIVLTCVCFYNHIRNHEFHQLDIEFDNSNFEEEITFSALDSTEFDISDEAKLKRENICHQLSNK